MIWIQNQEVCSIPNDDDFIAGELGCQKAEWIAAKAEILNEHRPLLTILETNRLFSRGLWKEAVKQRERREQLRQNGMQGGRPKNQKVISDKPENNQKQSLPSSSSSSSSIGTYTADCRVALFYLNEKSGNLFREARGNFELITARLKEPGVTIEGVKLMIDAKCREWKGTEWEKFLRPSTLFGRSKFDDYYGQRNKPAVPVNGHATKKPLPHGMTREQAMAAFSSGEIDEEPT